MRVHVCVHVGLSMCGIVRNGAGAGQAVYFGYPLKGKSASPEKQEPEVVPSVST